MRKDHTFLGSREEICPFSVSHDWNGTWHMPFQTEATFKHLSANAPHFGGNEIQSQVETALSLRCPDVGWCNTPCLLKLERVLWICWKFTEYDSWSKLVPTATIWGAFYSDTNKQEQIVCIGFLNWSHPYFWHSLLSSSSVVDGFIYHATIK